MVEETVKGGLDLKHQASILLEKLLCILHLRLLFLRMVLKKFLDRTDSGTLFPVRSLRDGVIRKVAGIIVVKRAPKSAADGILGSG